MKSGDSFLSRRRFLGSMVGGGMATLGAGAIVPLVQYAGNLRDEPPPDYLELSREEFDLAPGKAKMLLYGQIPMLIVRTPEFAGELKIFVAVCTHFDCTVGYVEGENRIFCACHEGYYGVDGEVISGPPPRPLKQFFQRPKGDRLIVALEEENLGKAFAESAAG
ncbi:MAG: ubiquinol-cytochrome c reductase iron-sulfur subunit [Gemmatimonadetes bacterium]|jgi:cytochrome b6-f complex iron-sulfur subunit|nr:ubiquinol-cytochrome c reductase iron-sulfur subunit [Gemmatimonadota bacterium]